MTDKQQDTEWLVEVEHAMPDCPSPAAAYAVMACPTKQKEWRSSEFAKLKVVLPDGVSEPVQKGDTYSIKLGPFSMGMNVLESTQKDAKGAAVLDTTGGGLCGLVKARVIFSFYTKNDGKVYGKAQEQQNGAAFFLIPPKEKIIGEHTTMFQELNDTFKKKQ